jgi:hypothetical protein
MNQDECLEERVSAIEKGLIGDFNSPGLMALVRQTNEQVKQTNDTIQFVKTKMEKVETDVSSIKNGNLDHRVAKMEDEMDAMRQTKAKMIGLASGIGLAGGGIGAAVAKMLGN